MNDGADTASNAGRAMSKVNKLGIKPQWEYEGGIFKEERQARKNAGPITWKKGREPSCFANARVKEKFDSSALTLLENKFLNHLVDTALENRLDLLDFLHYPSMTWCV